MARLAIGEVAKRAGIASSAIRYYEAEGLLPPAERENGRRIYDPQIVDRLTFIELAKRSGFTVAEIRRLLGGFARATPPGVRWRALAEKKKDELDRRISEARKMRELLDILTGCECPTLDACARGLREGRNPCELPTEP
jgi:MerR family redox-sensitive transcriptional activator SoxR